MSERSLTLIVTVQSLILLALAADRLMPVAHAQSVIECEIRNWPSVLAPIGAGALPVQITGASRNLPVEVKDWDTSDQVKVNVVDWNTSDQVKVGVVDWDTSDEVRIRQ